MKTLSTKAGLVAVIFISVYSLTQAQQKGSCGLYLSADDFMQNKLAYACDSGGKHSRIKLNSLLESSSGYIVCNGEKHVFNKSKIYGYCDSRNNKYRFYHNSAYRIVDTTGFFIYTRYTQTEYVKGKELVKKDEYFFSAGGNTAIERLSVHDLKKAFQENHSFHYALDAGFKSDQELTAYDEFMKMYKLKYLYSQSLATEQQFITQNKSVKK